MAALLLSARPEFGAVRSRDQQPLDSLFSVLRGRQNDEGGLGLWSSSPITAEFPTVYAAHVLLEARERGQKIPVEVLAALDTWLTRFASTPASSLAEGRLRATRCISSRGRASSPAPRSRARRAGATKRYRGPPTDLAAASGVDLPAAAAQR